MMMLEGFLRTLCGFIDGVVYWLVSVLYSLMTDLANTDFFNSNGGISTLTNHIYVLLGVIMLFKVAFSLLTYIVNPDQMSDSKAGAGSLVKNIVISIGLILVVPIVFDEAMNLQHIIIKNDVVGRIVTGYSRAGETDDVTTVGKNFSINILTGFLKPNSKSYPAACENTPTSSECYDASTIPSSYKKGITEGDIFSITSYDSVKATDGSDNFALTYIPIISTGVGIVIILVLINFCFDIAVRSVKLIFLRIISPLPIASYVDPSGQKGLFSKWVKACTGTYIDLFVRLAGIYFAFFIIQNVVLGGKLVTDNPNSPQWLINIAMILGCLLFAKQLPKLIEDLTGVKMGGDFSLNPMKRIGSVPLVGGAMVTGLGLAGRTGKNLAGFAGSSLGIGASAAGGLIKKTGVYKGISSKLSNGANAAGSFIAGSAIGKFGSNFANSKFGRNAGSYFGKIGADASSTIGGGLLKNSGNKKIAQYKKVADAVSSMETRAKDRITSGAAGALSARYTKEQAHITALKNMSVDGLSPADLESRENQIATATQNLNDWMNSNDNNGATSQYIDGVINGSIGDATMKNSMYEDYKVATAAGGFETKATASEMHSQMGSFKGKISDINRRQMAAQESKKK